MISLRTSMWLSKYLQSNLLFRQTWTQPHFSQWIVSRWYLEFLEKRFSFLIQKKKKINRAWCLYTAPVFLLHHKNMMSRVAATTLWLWGNKHKNESQYTKDSGAEKMERVCILHFCRHRSTEPRSSIISRILVCVEKKKY